VVAYGIGVFESLRNTQSVNGFCCRYWRCILMYMIFCLKLLQCISCTPHHFAFVRY